jgi:hypothetical protein
MRNRKLARPVVFRYLRGFLSARQIERQVRRKHDMMKSGVELSNELTGKKQTREQRATI